MGLMVFICTAFGANDSRYVEYNYVDLTETGKQQTYKLCMKTSMQMKNL